MKKFIVILILISSTVFSQEPKSIQFTGNNYEQVKAFCPKAQKFQQDGVTYLTLRTGNQTVKIWPGFIIVKRDTTFVVKNPSDFK